MDRNENIEYCIRYLMQQDGVDADMPTTLPERQRLLRALMNMWEPQALSDDFLTAQDRELRAQMEDKGVVEVRAGLWQGDITRLKVDAIVNAANSRGLGCWVPLHACIDNCIHSAAGLQLRAECHRQLHGGSIDTGSAIVTPGYNLSSRYVIHTVGPIIATGHPTAEQEEQLAQCYRTCIERALQKGCRNIALCCISTGEFHFPNRRAAEIAVSTVGEYRSAIDVVYNVFKDTDYEIYRELLGKD